MGVSTAVLVAGSVSLGRWGLLRVDGLSAVVKARKCEDIVLPSELLDDRNDWGWAGQSDEVGVLDEHAGRLLLLPVGGGEIVACLDLAKGGLAYPMVRLAPRNEGRGMRYGDAWFVQGWGVIHVTDRTLCRFDDSLELVWRHGAP